MNLINKIFNRKIAGDTSNIILPDATGIDSGIEYKSAVNSNVPNGLFNHISDAIQYLQFSVGLYSNTAQYTEGNICKVITKENGHYQIRVFRRNGNNAGSTVANPPVPTNKTTTNGIDCYEVENETEWNTDWDECETGLAYWEFKIEGKTITEATQSFDNRDSVGATWTKAHIQELYDSVRNFRVVYYYNCLITTHNIVKEGNVIKGSFSFENIARYTMKFEYNLDANSFTSCSCNIFHYNTSIKELNSDQLYNSVKGNILKVSRFENVSFASFFSTDTTSKPTKKYTIPISQLLNLPANISVQGFSLQRNSGSIGIGNNAYNNSFFSVILSEVGTVAIFTRSLLKEEVVDEYVGGSIFVSGTETLYHCFDLDTIIIYNPDVNSFQGDLLHTSLLEVSHCGNRIYNFVGDTLEFDMQFKDVVQTLSIQGIKNTPLKRNIGSITRKDLTCNIVLYYYEV